MKPLIRTFQRLSLALILLFKEKLRGGVALRALEVERVTGAAQRLKRVLGDFETPEGPAQRPRVVSGRAHAAACGADGALGPVGVSARNTVPELCCIDSEASCSLSCCNALLRCAMLRSVTTCNIICIALCAMHCGV